MITLLSSELRKLTSTRAPWIMSAVLLAAAAGILALLLAGGPQGFDLAGAEQGLQLTGSLGFGVILSYLLGVVAVTVDHRHGTHVPTYLATPRRGRVLAAKLLSASVVGTLVAVLSVLVAFVIGLPWLGGHGVDLGTVLGDPLFWTRLLAASVGIVLMAVFGAAVAALVRSTVAAVFVLLGLFAIESIVELQAPGELFDWLLFNSLFTFMSPPDPSRPIGGLPYWVGGPIVVGWIAVVAVAATVRTLRGDVR